MRQLEGIALAISGPVGHRWAIVFNDLFNNRKNRYLFRDTLTKMVQTPNVELKELTAQVQDVAFTRNYSHIRSP
jgi:hypothetical protein